MSKISPKTNKKANPDQERSLILDENVLPLFIFGKGKMANWKTRVLHIWQTQPGHWKGSYEPLYGNMVTPNCFFGDTKEEVINKLKIFISDIPKNSLW